MKQKYIGLYTDFAHRIAELSHARRLKVGAVIVKDDVVTYGYNGMPTGWENDCEYKEYPDRYDKHPEWADLYFPLQEPDGTYYRLKTRPEVLHAESNAVSKMAKSTVSAQDADMFITHSPCIDCAKLIFQAGVRRVFYSTDYSSRAGVEFLEKSGVVVEKITK